MKYILKKVLLLLFIFSCNQEMNNPSPTPKVVEGKIDLTEYDFSTRKPISLDGYWEFYPEKFLSPKNFELENSKKSSSIYENYNTYMKVPGTWTRENEYGEKFQNDMDATYRLEIQLPESSNESSNRFSIRMPTVGTAYRLYWNGQFLAEEGDTNNPENAGFRAPIPRILELENSKNKINELLIQVSNRAHQNGGIWWPVTLGSHSAVLKANQESQFLVLFLFGALLIMGVYHIGYFLVRRSEWSSLYFGSFSISIGIWIMQSGENLFSIFFPKMSWNSAIRLEYGSFYFGILLFPLFLSSLFRKESMPLFRKTIIILASIIFSTTFYLPFGLFLRTLPFAQMLAGLVIIYCMVLIARAGWKNLLGARSMGLSLVILSATVAHDIFFASIVFETTFIAPYGFLIFIIGQSFVLAMYHSNVYKRLEELKSNLEDTVVRRTATLNSLNELTRNINATRDIDAIVSYTSNYMIEFLGVKRMFLMLVIGERNEINAHGGTTSKEEIQDSDFFNTLRGKINPDLGTLYRTISRKKTVQIDLSKITNITSYLDRKVIEHFHPNFLIEIPITLENESIRNCGA